ncbi:MAG TPA: hypothetical protein DEP87_01860 [Candidatus Pacebacteria bacterium]|nr:hypothetical protein [Candidatus Paceibacterota bacterium]
MSSSPKILITGGLGFIGQSLARQLIKLNQFPIILDQRHPTKTERAALSGAKIIVGDVTDSEVWKNLPAVTYVYHFAAPSSIALFNQNPTECIRTSIQGLLNAFVWAKAHSVIKVIYPSSGSIFDNGLKACSEKTLPNPTNLYGQTKLVCENLAQNFTELVPSLGLRIFAGYGPLELQKGEIASVVSLFLKAIFRNETPKIYGAGFQTRDFVYIDDIVATLIAVMTPELTGFLNVGSGQAISFNEVLKELNQKFGTDIKPVYIDKPENYLENTLCDARKMTQILGRKPLSFKTGISRYFDQLTQN